MFIASLLSYKAKGPARDHHYSTDAISKFLMALLEVTCLLLPRVTSTRLLTWVTDQSSCVAILGEGTSPYTWHLTTRLSNA